MWRATIAANARSEEHTSELQSRRDLVCRLLLEKQKKDGVRLVPAVLGRIFSPLQQYGDNVTDVGFLIVPALEIRVDSEGENSEVYLANLARERVGQCAHDA